MRHLLATFVLLATFAVPRLAGAGTFGDGNAAYRAGDYPGAIASYERLVKEGVRHESLFYNLGNAYFRNGDLGRAIFNYERALRIEPGMDDAEYNLAVARETVAEKVVDRLKGAEEEPLWMRTVTYFSISDLTIAFLLFNVVFFVLLIIMRFLSTGMVRAVCMVLAVATGLGALSSGVLLNRHLHVLEDVHQAIVIDAKVVMREGPDGELAERGQLHAGIRVTVLEKRAGWVKLRLANGVEGWIPAESLGVL